MNYSRFIHSYVQNHVPDFNTKLFKRSDDAIIDQMEKIIISCQTEGLYTIKVLGFTVVDNYTQIKETLREYYEQAKRTSRSKRSIDDNQYNYIELKDSDIKLLIVHYYLGAKGEFTTADVIIEIPRVVNKFYFYLSGNYYYPMYQIVDSSTYNNSSAKSSRSSCVTLKANFPPIKVYKHEYVAKSTKGLKYKLTQYDCNAFEKTVSTVIYIFAKFGLAKGLEQFKLSNYFYFSTEDISTSDPTWVSFAITNGAKTNFFVSVPEVVIKNPIVQHILYTIITNASGENTTVADLFNIDFWITKLGSRFGSKNTHDKGLSVLSSLESAIDINFQEQLHIPWNIKKDVYSILEWVICEYGFLKLKNNMDITTKKLRCAEYIAAMYAIKLSTGIYRLSGMGRHVDIKNVKKVIYTKPDFIITNITGDLVAFRNIVNDMDSFLPLKFTYKGISGIGNKSNSIPNQFKLLDISHMGILDPDASSPSDPGVSGMVVPFVKMYDNGYFVNDKESNTWDSELTRLSDNYKKVKGLEEVITFKNKILDQELSEEDCIVTKQSKEMLQALNESMAKNIVTNDQIIRAHIDSITGKPIK